MAKKKTFESALQELEKIVREMESGDLNLEESVGKYEQGIQLSKFCLDTLDQIEKKISLITVDQNGDVKETPFDHET